MAILWDHGEHPNISKSTSSILEDWYMPNTLKQLLLWYTVGAMTTNRACILTPVGGFFFSRRVQRQTRPRLLGKVETGDFGPNFLSLGAMGNVSLKDGSGRVRVQNDLHSTFKVVDWNSYSIVNPWGRQMRSFHLRHLRNKASTDLPKKKAARANYFSWGRWRLAGVCLGPFTFPWTLVNSPSKARRIYIWKLLSHPANARAKQRAKQTNCCSF